VRAWRSTGTLIPRITEEKRKKIKIGITKKITASLLGNKRHGDRDRVPLQRGANWLV